MPEQIHEAEIDHWKTQVLHYEVGMAWRSPLPKQAMQSSRKTHHSHSKWPYWATLLIQNNPYEVQNCSHCSSRWTDPARLDWAATPVDQNFGLVMAAQSSLCRTLGELSL